MKTGDGIEVKTIRCDNAGKNKELEKTMQIKSMGSAHDWSTQQPTLHNKTES